MSPSGILNVNKDPGPTSFDVVRFVRNRSGVQKVGHAGTLDPSASGVLLVCLGQAVRVTEYLMRLPKVYRARICLGIETDTYDAEGTPASTGDISDVTEARLRPALAAFVGTIDQVPPPYSAVKVGGERAYRLARRGETALLRPRRATVYRLDLLGFEPPFAEIEVECGRGTYIRSLAHDLGQRLGCGAHLSALVRTRIGPFNIEDARTMARLEAAFTDGSWQDILLPIDLALMDLPALTLGIEDEKDIRHGQPVRLDPETTVLPDVPEGAECRAYGEDGSLVAIVAYDTAEGMWRPRRVFQAS